MHDKLILIGVITKAHGIKGEVVIKSFTSPIQNILTLPLFYLPDKLHSITAQSYHSASGKDSGALSIKLISCNISFNSKNDLICKTNIAEDRDTAIKLVRTALYCLRSSLPSIDTADEFYTNDLIGLRILNHQHQDIGLVSYFANYGAGDIIAIKFHKSGKEVLFPFDKEFFPVITKDYLLCSDIVMENYSKSGSNKFLG